MKIRIIKRVPFAGRGDTLVNRLKRVTLRGFPDVQIYKDAQFEVTRLAAGDIAKVLHTPQPHVYTAHIQQVDHLAALLREAGINLFHLDAAYDYIAVGDDGAAATWTIAPPVAESFYVPRHAAGGFDYAPLLGPELRATLRQHGWQLNPALQTAPYTSKNGVFNIINDGSHRVHAGLESGEGITTLVITGMTPGFPYYAAPQAYDLVTVFAEGQAAQDLKLHVVAEPGQKQLYRLFPSGGIFSGEVRPAKSGEVFL